MTSASRVNVRWTVLALAALVLLSVGAGATYLGLRSNASSQPGQPAASAGIGSTPADPVASAPPASETLSDVMVTLSPEAVERAGITFTEVAAGAALGGVRAPGVVEPNAYKQIVVTPLVSGRLTRVTAELGQRVQRGQTIAQIFSPELAEAQTRYVSARAELTAHDQKLARTEQLVHIGAASRQELERVHAEHTARRAEVQSAASRLQLLGLSAGAIEGLDPGQAADATTSVPAPIAGVITQRAANVGTNVDQSTQLFTVVDLSTVWVVADLYEKDFARVRVGSTAIITTAAYPDLALPGRVSYIDPQVSTATRTAKVRVEVPNARHELRFGMYVEVLLAGEGGGASTPMVPRTAVQNVGDRTVVYLVVPKEPGTFVERELRLGMSDGDHVTVLDGVKPGDLIVGTGSFSVRAERERLGLRQAPPRPTAVGGNLPSRRSGQPSPPSVQTANIEVREQGFEPATVRLRAGGPARVTIIRTTDKTCGTEVVFPSLDIRRVLPLDQPVVIEFTPSQAGDIAFACGMNMLKGVVVVSARTDR